MLQVFSIEELTTEEIQLARQYINDRTKKGSIDDIYWLLVPDNKLTDIQTKLLSTVGPFKIAIELMKDKIRFELLSRSEALDNLGGGILTDEQRQFVHGFFCSLYNHLNIKDKVKINEKC